MGPSAGNHANRNQAADPTADNGKRGAKELGDCAGFHLTELRPTGKKDLVDAGHPPANVIRRAQLADGVADDGADRIRSTDQHQCQHCQPKTAHQTEEDGRQPKSHDREQEQRALAADLADL